MLRRRRFRNRANRTSQRPIAPQRNHPRWLSDSSTSLPSLPNANVLSILIAHGADVDTPAQTPARQAPLHSAAASRNTQVVALLLGAGANPDAQQHGGYTALHSAATHGNASMIRVLLSAGADVSVRCDEEKERSRDAPRYIAGGCANALFGFVGREVVGRGGHGRAAHGFSRARATHLPSSAERSSVAEARMRTVKARFHVFATHGHSNVVQGKEGGNVTPPQSG